MTLDIHAPRGVCLGCPFEERCHQVRKHVIDGGLTDRGQCPFYPGLSAHNQEVAGVRKNTWSIMRAGYAPRIIEDLRQDVEILKLDMPDHDCVVPEALVSYVEKALGVVGGMGHVRVIAFATDDGRAFSADVHIQPGLAPA